MKEQFIHYTWKTRNFNPAELTTTNGEPLEIVYPGDYNTNSGPDFFNAKIKIGEQIWSGNVEIHIKASDWEKHRHQYDEAYNNVILHVVCNADKEIKNQAGKLIPALDLHSRIDKLQYIRFLRLYTSKESIPCVKRIHEVQPILITGMLSRLLVERLERKVALLKQELELNKGDWEETFYRHIARQFGMKVNAEPFQWLAAAVPYRILSKSRNNLLLTEALLFGQSGLLPEKKGDSYTNTLIREYTHLQNLHGIRPLPSHTWKFMRLRPNNFPTIRIAQLAGLFFRQEKLFRTCMECQHPEQLKSIFDIQVSAYWENHYLFGKISKRSVKKIGAQAVDTLMINTVVPFMFLSGQMKGDQEMMDRAILFLETLPPENNSIIRNWESFGVGPVSAAESQALIELTGNYCEKKNCLQCAIGCSLMKK